MGLRLWVHPCISGSHTACSTRLPDSRQRRSPIPALSRQQCRCTCSVRGLTIFHVKWLNYMNHIGHLVLLRLVFMYYLAPVSNHSVAFGWLDPWDHERPAMRLRPAF